MRIRLTDLYHRWFLYGYLPLFGGVGFYRGINSSKEDDLMITRTAKGFGNGVYYIFAPYYPICKTIGRLEIEYFKPHLREKNQWVYRELFDR